MWCDTWLGSFHPLGGDTEGEGHRVDAVIATVAMVLQSSSRHTVTDVDLDHFVRKRQKLRKIEASLT